jgi:outer membrane lipoprotein-sorting protein
MTGKAIALGFALTASIFAAQTATQIMEEVHRRAHSDNFRYDGRITTRKANGAKDQKSWRCERLGEAGSSKMMLRFLDPADIRGVALLVWNHSQKPSEMWLYTPALARTRRIAQQDRSSRFAGTDFSFEDFEESDTSSWDYSEMQEEQEGGEACWRITAHRSTTHPSQYDREWIWVSKEKMTPLRIDKFRGGKLARRLTMHSLESRQGIWTPMRVEVVDLLGNSSTTLELVDAHYNQRMPESQFTLEAAKGSW